MIFYGCLLLAFVGTMVGKFNQANTKQAPESRVVKLTSPPRSFISSDTKHALLTLDDFTANPRPSAVMLVLRRLHEAAGPESGAEPRSAAPDYTELEIDESITFPGDFRGGFVKTRGVLLGIDTRGPEDSLTYRGWLIVHVGREDRMVVWETDVIPEFEKGEMLDLKGVFLQAVTYEDGKGRPRTAPFIAVGSLARTPPAEHPSSFRDKLFSPVAIVLIILILATTLFLTIKSRRSASPNRYVARPPGPGR